MKNREPWNFCETPKEKCTMNYCHDNGCQNRKRNDVEGNDLIADVRSSLFTGQSNDLPRQKNIPFHITEWDEETKEIKKEYPKVLNNFIQGIK